MKIRILLGISVFSILIFGYSNCGRLKVVKDNRDLESVGLLSPSQLAVVDQAVTKISLRWQDNAFSESGYEIQRSESPSGPFVPIGTASANATMFTDDLRPPNSRYYYRVRTVFKDKYSDFSDVAEASTIPLRYRAAPHGLPGYNGLASAMINDVEASGTTIYVGTNSGLSISNDSGVSFRTATTKEGLADNNILDLYLKGSRLYVATIRGLSISTDGGNTFTSKDVTSGLVNSAVSAIATNDVGDRVYVGTNGGISISTDFGATFLQTSLVGYSVNSLVVKGDEVFAASYVNGLFYSNNKGMTFTQRGLGPVDSVYCLFLDPKNPNRILAGLNYGLAISTDNGVTFTKNTSGPLAARVTDISFDGSKIALGTFLKGLLISLDDGATFTQKNVFSNYVHSVGFFGNKLLIGTDYGFVQSEDLALFVPKVPTTTINVPNISNVVADSKNVYVTTSSVLNRPFYVSQDGGKTFSSRGKSNGLLTDHVSLVAASDTLVAAVNADGLGVVPHLAISTDRGTSFSVKTAGVPYTYATTLYVQDSTVYIGTSEGQVVTTTDKGMTFKTTNLPYEDPDGFGVNVSSILKFKNLLLVGTSVGLFVSGDSGLTYTHKVVADGLPSLTVTSLGTDKDSYYVGTSNGLAKFTEGIPNPKTLNVSNGLRSNNITSIAIRNGLLMVGTYDGIGLSVNGGENFYTFGKEQGLSNLTANSLSFFGDQLFVGTQSGLNLSY